MATRIVLLGAGAISSRFAELLTAAGSGQLVGVITRGGAAPRDERLAGVPCVRTADDLAAAAPDVVLEAASREAVSDWTEIALGVARRVVISSSSALADDGLRTRLIDRARLSGSQLVLSPGALAGIEALAAARHLELYEVRHRIVKPPRAWTGPVGGPPADPVRRHVVFEGSAREAARSFPRNANVVVVSALAGIGLDRTQVELISDPAAERNSHEIEATGAFGHLRASIENRPLAENPLTSEQAALALLRLALNEAPGLVI